jgi:hypothetical protein
MHIATKSFAFNIFLLSVQFLWGGGGAILIFLRRNVLHNASSEILYVLRVHVLLKTTQHFLYFDVGI